MATFTLSFTAPDPDDWYDDASQIADRSEMIAERLRTVTSQVVSRLAADTTNGKVYDLNGNAIGTFELTP